MYFRIKCIKIRFNKLKTINNKIIFNSAIYIINLKIIINRNKLIKQIIKILYHIQVKQANYLKLNNFLRQ